MASSRQSSFITHDFSCPIVIVGHIDHGKSTLIGRLLHDTGALKEEQLATLHPCSSALGELEFAFALDALEEERAGAVTMETTQVFFNSSKRRYAIIDVPGHLEFLKSMITGSSYAEAAVLVVDVVEGVQEQTKRHAYFLYLIGLQHIIVVFNKMDQVGFSPSIYETVRSDMIHYLDQLPLKPQAFIPISAKTGINIISNNESMPWYDGPCLLSALDDLILKSPSEKAFRFPVQDVYRRNDERILVGRVESGEIQVGKRAVILPEKNQTTVKTISKFQLPSLKVATQGEAVGIILENVGQPKRGDILVSDDHPMISQDFKARVFWFDGTCRQDDKVVIKQTTQDIEAQITILNKFDPAMLDDLISNPNFLEMGEAAEVRIFTDKAIIIDRFLEIPNMGRFVIESQGVPVGAGIVL